MEYLKNCKNQNDYTLFAHSNDAAPNHVAHIELNDEVVYKNAPVGADEYYFKPFTIEITNTEDTWDYYPVQLGLNNQITEGDKYVKFSYNGGQTWQDVSTDGNTWHQIPRDTPIMIISNYAAKRDSGDITINLDGNYVTNTTIHLSGNICSLGGGLSLFIEPELMLKNGRMWYFANTQYDLDAENLWLPSYYICHDLFSNGDDGMFKNSQITKAPHIIISKMIAPVNGVGGNTNRAYGPMFSNTYKLSDATNVVWDIPKNMKYYGGTEGGPGGDDFIFMFNNSDIEQNQPALTLNLPEYITIKSQYFSTYAVFTRRKLAAHTGNTQKYVFLCGGEYTANNMFEQSFVTDMSYVWLFNVNGIERLYAGSTVTKTARLYNHDYHSEMFADCSNLTDVYLYGTNFPDYTIGMNSDWTGTIHTAPWADTDSLNRFKQEYPSATFVVDNDAIMSYYMDGTNSYTNAGIIIDNKFYMETRYMYPSDNYPLSINKPYNEFSSWLGMPSTTLSHIVYQGKWYEPTYVEDIEDVTDINQWWGTFTVSKFTFTDDLEITHTFFVWYKQDEAVMVFTESTEQVYDLGFCANIPDSMKFKYIN